MREISFQCPFCGARTRADGDKVAHEMPMCAPFDDSAPDVFLRLVNDEIARQRGYRIVRFEDKP